MTLEQLRIFVAVAERQHVTQAAAELHLTQSAVSSAIAALEARHDIRLFDRVGRNVLLNQNGRVFLDEARAVLARAAAAETALADLGGLRRGKLSVHASLTIASYWFPERVVAYRKAYPHIDIEVQIGNTAEVAKAVAEGFSELGLVEGEVDDPVLSRQPIGHDQPIIVVGAAHPWAERGDLAPADLLGESWVLREPGSGTRSAFEAALKTRGVDPGSLPIVLTLPANEAVLAAVQAGLGATAISASVARAALSGGQVRRVAFDLPARLYYVLRHKARFRSKAGDAFLALAREMRGD
jgi:DNA-binding transcriptional LysR family regulator